MADPNKPYAGGMKEMNHSALIELWVKQIRIAHKTTYRTPTDLVREKTKTQLASEQDRARVLGEALKALYGKHPLDIVTKDTVVTDGILRTVATIVEAVV